MQVHHLNCGTLCPHGSRMVTGEGGLFEAAEVVCHCLLVETDDGLVLVDTGFGLEDASDPGRLGAAFRYMMRPRPTVASAAISQVEALGFAAGDVRHIVATHLDVDHAGGLPDFPEAQVHVLTPELEEALNPRFRERTRYVGGAHWSHEPRWVRHAAGGDEWFGFQSTRILPGIDAEVLLIPLIGHSRGHTGVAVNSDDGWLLHCGDAYFHRGQVATPRQCPAFLDGFQRMLAFDGAARRDNEERLRELAARHGDEVHLFSAHDRNELAQAQERAGAAVAAE